MMKHFEAIEWSDLARGVAPAELALKMRMHLEEGCTSCGEISAQMTKMVSMTKREASYDPPSETTRLAKSLLSATKLAAPSRAEGQFLKLVFDSLTQPLLAGVR